MIFFNTHSKHSPILATLPTWETKAFKSLGKQSMMSLLDKYGIRFGCIKRVAQHDFDGNENINSNPPARLPNGKWCLNTWIWAGFPLIPIRGVGSQQIGFISADPYVQLIQMPSFRFHSNSVEYLTLKF